MAPLAIELFAGAGGLSLGFEQAGFATVQAIEIEANAVETYRFNRPWLPSSRVILGDIRERRDEVFSSAELPRHLDVLLGGVPCQSFSTANRQPLEDDPRTELYREFIHAVDRARPRVVVVENVLGIRRIAPEITRAFDRIGYHVDHRVLDAADYGLPQNRRRVFFVGCERTDLLRDTTRVNQVFDLVHQLGERQPRRTLSDALYGLRPLTAHPEAYATDREEESSGFTVEPIAAAKENEYIRWINEGRLFAWVFNHRARYNNERDVEIFDRLPQGGYSDDPSIADLMPYKSRSEIFRDKYYRLRMDEPCKTITAHMKFDCNMYIHPEQARGLTPREAARLQGFPDDYVLRGAFTRWYEQVGNAVPPPLARMLATAIIEVFELGEIA